MTPTLLPVEVSGAESLSIIRLTQIGDGEFGATAFADDHSAEQRRGRAGGKPPATQTQAAAFFRFASSRASTSATCASIAGWLRPFCLAISCTSLSARSMNCAPFCSARAADAGRERLCAAAAYFSNGTKSAGLAPSLTQRSNTKLYTDFDSSMFECTASCAVRMPSLVMQR